MAGIELGRVPRDHSGRPLANASAPRPLTLFTSNIDEARTLLVDELGCTLLKDTHNRLVLNAHGREFLLVQIEQVNAVTNGKG